MRTPPLAAVLLAGVLLAGCRRAVTPPPEYTVPALVPPLCDAQVGERLVTRRGAEQWEYTVVSSAEVEVVVEVVRTLQGAPQGRPQRFTFHRNGFGLPERDVVLQAEPGRLALGGRTWPCWVLHVANAEHGRFYYWISPEVAVHGVLKIARSDGGAPEEASAITWAADSLSGRDAR